MLYREKLQLHVRILQCVIFAFTLVRIHTLKCLVNTMTLTHPMLESFDYKIILTVLNPECKAQQTNSTI